MQKTPTNWQTGWQPARVAMRGILQPALLIALLLALTPLAPWPAAPARAAEDIQAGELMRKIDALWRGKSSRARMTMRVITRRYSRSMTMEAWSEGKEKSLVRILSPKKDQGIATLKVDENIWNYLPKINRVTKVAPSMMMGSWMGSHFTNDDLVRESSFEEDYHSAITFRGVREGQEVVEVTSQPRPEAVVVWGKVVTLIDSVRLLPVWARYFDEDGVLAREMRFLEVKNLGGREIPTLLRLIPQDKPEESTEIVYEAMEFDVPVPAGTFSLRSLQR